MKISFSSLLLLAFLSVSAMAATTTINKNDAEVQDYGGPMNEYVFTYGDTNLKLNSKISFGGDVMVTLRWEGKSAGSYTLTGNGSMPYRTVWNLDSGTYEFKANPGNWAIITGAGLWGDSTHLILDTAANIERLADFERIEIQNAGVKIANIDNTGTISSSHTLSSKNINDLIGYVRRVEADVLLNGGELAMTDRDEAKTHVDGKVSFKGKNLLTYNLRPDYFDPNGRDGYAWINEPTNQDIAEALDGMTLFTCKSYSGSASSLCLTVKYYTVENVFGDSYNGGYSLGKGSCNASALGTFIPLYDADEGCYRFVFFSYERITEINARDLYDNAYWAGAENLYIKKAVTFGTKEEVTFTWSGDGESYALIGKGMVASKGKLNVLISNGAFTLSSGCGFKNASYTLSDAKVSSMGALNAANLIFTDSSWDVSGGKMVAKGAVSLEDSSIVTDSAVTVAALDMKDGSSIELESSKAQSVTINGKNSDNRLDASYLDVAGKMSVAGNLELAGASSSIRLYDPSGKNKAMPLAVKGSLTLGSGSTLTLSGALSAKDMVIEGGTINLTGSKLATIKVGNSLTLNAATDINYNFAVTQKDVDRGKAFKILTFKSSNLQGQDVESLYNLLGLSEEYCTLVWDKKQTSLSLKVTDLEGWNEAKVSDEDAEATVPAAVAALVNPALPDYSGVADALVQVNWGLVESSRAFVNTIANRSMAVQLGSGERAVWASAIAGSSRRSSSGTHGGADTNITGGAIGMETQLGENSLLGMALGNSWTRVSAHNYGTIKQDTTHLGLYGQTNWNKLSADWSAAYGRSESKFNGSDWSQKAIQLDGRLSYNHALSETVLLRGFGGVQYYASDSARVDGLDTGEVQNLRGEIGVGIVRSTQKSSVYAELALHQDLVRDNPEVRSPFGQRYHGTNPGRTGINLTIGGSYALSDQWSVNASYTAEVVENANAHSVNVGATYKF